VLGWGGDVMFYKRADAIIPTTIYQCCLHTHRTKNTVSQKINIDLEGHKRFENLNSTFTPFLFSYLLYLQLGMFCMGVKLGLSR
jgi:hypothetical protein